MAISDDIQRLDPGARVELFELDLTQISRNSADHYYFHSGTNGLGGDVVWKGVTYARYPVEASGFDMMAKGTLPRPSLKVANVTGIMTALVAAYDDLIGAKVIRRRTMVRYLDVANFPPQRNLMVRSDAMNTNVWTYGNLTDVKPKWTTGPDGKQSAHLIVPSAAAAGHTVNRDIAGFTAGQTITGSVYAKKTSNQRYLVLQFAPTGAFLAGAVDVRLDLETGAFLTGQAGTPVRRSASYAGDGWWRLELTAIPAAAGLVRFIMYMSASPTNYSLAGDGVSGVLMANPQLELNSAPTEYQEVGTTFSANPHADPTQAFPDDIFYIERKVRQSSNSVEFELCSAMDLQGQKLPNRVITTNVCQWVYRRRNAANTAFEYETFGCPYTGTNYFTVDGIQTADPAADVCSKLLETGCKKRFPLSTDVLPFGGFPGAKAYNF